MASEEKRIIVSILQIKAMRLAISSLIVSTCITVVMLFLISATRAGYKDGFYFELGGLTPAYSIPLSVFFVISFVFIWFLLYVQYTKDAEDIYSMLREKLTGSWIVQYDLKNGKEAHQSFDGRPTIGCNIIVNPENKKLEFSFIVHNHKIWLDGEDSKMRNISLRHDRDSNYTLAYYFKSERGLQPKFAQHIVPESDGQDVSKIEIEVFGYLNFESPDAKQICHMKGEWFDLNGNMTRVVSLIEEIKLHSSDDRLFKKSLSDVTIDHRNFSAAMGEIEFIRQ